MGQAVLWVAAVSAAQVVLVDSEEEALVAAAGAGGFKSLSQSTLAVSQFLPNH